MGEPEATFTELADQLDRADRARVAMPIPAAERVSDLASAYAVQERFFARRAARLQVAAAGFKVALSSLEAQRALGADEPAAGRYTIEDVYPSGAVIPSGRCFSPLLEVELVFRVRSDLTPGASVEAIADRTDVTGGIESPDSRYRNWFGGDFPALSLPQVVADNCLAGILVVGDRWIPSTDVDVPQVQATLSIGSQAVAGGGASNVLGNPLRSVAWLAGHLAERGERLTAGTLVSSGTLTAPVRVRPGRIEAAFTEGLGKVTVEFESGTGDEEKGDR